MSKLHNFNILFLCLVAFPIFAQKEGSCTYEFEDFTGTCYSYHANNNPEWKKSYEKGKPIGKWIKYDQNGNVIKTLESIEKRDSIVAADKMIWGKDIAFGSESMTESKQQTNEQNNKEDEIFVFVEEDAVFNGNMNDFISKNLVYPIKSLELGEQGKVYLEFVIEKDGSISNIKLIRGLSNEINKEAIRIITLMPKWKPAMQFGKVVRSRYVIPINFVIPK